MASLRMSKNGQLIQEITLEQGQTYLAGRGESCQLKLDPEPGISRQHFQISYVGNLWILEVTSRYGELYVNNEKAQQTVQLNQNLRFSVPPYEFDFVMDTGSASASVSSSSVSSNDVPVSVPVEALEKTFVQSQANIAYLKMFDAKGNPKQIFRLEGEAWTAGRDVTCALFIDNPRVSRKQFEVYKENDQYFIRDLGSANGTIVNGQHISSKDWTLLQSGDIISVIDWTLNFELRDALFDQKLDDIKTEFKKSPLITETGSQSVSSDSFNEGSQAHTRYEALPPDPYAGQYQQGQPGFASYPPPSPYGMVGDPGSQGAPPPYQAPPMDNRTQWQKIKSQLNFPRVAILVLLLGALVYGVFFNQKDTKPKAPIAKSDFDKLSPEDQQYVIQTYNAAEAYLKQQNFQNAYDEIQKMKSKIPKYKDSLAIEKMAKVFLDNLEQERREKQLEQERAEAEAKIRKQVEECRASINKDTVEVSTIENCLAPVIPLNPSHSAIAELKQYVENLVLQRKLKKEQDEAHRKAVAQLKALYSKALAVDKTGEKPRDAIRAYELVVRSQLPDPGKLKIKSKNRIAAIKKQMQEDQEKFIVEANRLINENKYKEAILLLQKAMNINPDSVEVRTRLDQAMLELKKQMQVIFHESIIEESVGDVEPAKLKWKRIMESSVQTEEYFEKARLKLRKYGAVH